MSYIKLDKVRPSVRQSVSHLVSYLAIIVVWWLACSAVDRKVGGSNLPCAGAL